MISVTTVTLFGLAMLLAVTADIASYAPNVVTVDVQADVPMSRRSESKTFIVDDVMYIYGGIVYPTSYDVTFDLWKIDLYGDGKLIHVGGPINAATKCTFEGDKTIPTDAKVLFPAAKDSEIVLHRSKILFVGGYDDAWNEVYDVWEFDPSANTFALIELEDNSNEDGSLHDKLDYYSTFRRGNCLMAINTPSYGTAAWRLIKIEDTVESVTISDSPIDPVSYEIDEVLYDAETDTLYVFIRNQVLRYSFVDDVWRVNTIETTLSGKHFEEVSWTIGYAMLGKDTFALFPHPYETSQTSVFQFQGGDAVVETLSEDLIPGFMDLMSESLHDTQDSNGNIYALAWQPDVNDDEVDLVMRVMAPCCGDGSETVTSPHLHIRADPGLGPQPDAKVGKYAFAGVKIPGMSGTEEMIARVHQYVHIVDDVLYVYGGRVGPNENIVLNDLWKLDLNGDGTLIHVGGQKNQGIKSNFIGDVTVPTDAKVSFPPPQEQITLASRKGKLLFLIGNYFEYRSMTQVWEFDPSQNTFALVHNENVELRGISSNYNIGRLSCSFERQDELFYLGWTYQFDESYKVMLSKLNGDFRKESVSPPVDDIYMENSICVYMPAKDVVHFVIRRTILTYSFAANSWTDQNMLTTVTGDAFKPTFFHAGWRINDDTFAVVTGSTLVAIDVQEDGVHVMQIQATAYENIAIEYETAAFDSNGNGYIPVAVYNYTTERRKATVQAFIRCCGQGFESVVPTGLSITLPTVAPAPAPAPVPAPAPTPAPHPLPQVLPTCADADIDDYGTCAAKCDGTADFEKEGGFVQCKCYESEDNFTSICFTVPVGATLGESVENSTSVALIAGGAVGGVTVVALGAYLVCRRRRRLKVDNSHFVNHGKRGVDTVDVPMGHVV